MSNLAMKVSIYPEVVEILGFELVREKQNYDDDDDEDGSLGFALKKMIFPLGIGGKQWSFNPLGLVTNLSHAGPNVPQQRNEYDAKLHSLDKERHSSKIFSLEFTSKELPFDVNLHTSGKLIVTKCYTQLDPRIHRGVTIFAVNRTPLPISQNSFAVFAELLGNVSVPFTLVFEPIDPLHHHTVPYEEEDDEVDEGQPQDEEDEEEEEEEEDEENTQDASQGIPKGHNSNNNGNNYKKPINDKAGGTFATTSIFRKTMSTLSNRVRALVVGNDSDINPELNLSGNTSNSTNNTSLRPEDALPPVPPNTYTVNEDGSFNVILTTRSPPFVFDLHADGRSIVVVKLLLLDAGRDPDSLLQEGCVVRRLNGRVVMCSARHDFEVRHA